MKHWMRLLSLLLLTIVTGGAFAQTPISVEAGANLKDVFDGINASPQESYVITLNGDVNFSDEAQYRHPALTAENNVTKNVTIKGNGHTITFAGGGVRGFYTESTVAQKVTFEDLTIKDDTRYDAENGNNAWEFAYLEFGEKNSCAIEFNNVKFIDGISVDGTNTTFNNCEFIADGNDKRSTQTAESCMWISNGDVTVNNCSFTGYRGIKMHEAYGTEIGTVNIDGCTFKDITVKPAVAIGTLNAGTTVNITDCAIENVRPGDQGYYLFESDTDLANFTNNISGNSFTVSTADELSKAVSTGFFSDATLKNDIALTEDIACGMTEGTFTLNQGDNSVSGGNITIKQGVTINTDKQTTIFKPENNQLVVNETASSTGYAYTAEVDYVAQIGTTKYETLAAAVAAAQTGDVIEVIKAGDYTLPGLSKNVTIEGKADGVVSFTYTKANSSIASVPNGATFKNVTFNWGNVNYHGFQEAGTITMEGCTLNGKFFSYADMNFTNCEFVNAGDYNMWVYGAGNVVYDQCTFTNSTTGKLLHLYCEGAALHHKVTVKDCKFVNGGSLSKSAINVKATSGSNALQYELYLEGNNTVEGSFPTAVGEQDNSDHTWILSPLAQVDDRAVNPDNIKVYENDVLIYPVNYVAQIGTTKYSTLAAAAAAAQTGETITLLADISDTGNISLKAGVTLDGDGKTISGNSAIYINKDGGTVKNVNFDNIHNSNSKLSAIYGSSLAGTATITGCTFDNCDWDAIQITPVAGANVVITDNAFSDDNEDGVTQQRYIHVQSAQNVDFSATINENVMTGKLKQEPIGVYYPTDKTKVDLTKNYIESINDICILIADNNGYAGELVFPAYTTAEKTETYSPVAKIANGQYAANFYATLQAAVDAATAGAQIDILKDFTLTTVTTQPSNKYNVNVNKSVTINGNGYTITSSTGKRPLVLTGEGNDITIKDLTVVNNKADWTLGITNALTCTLDGVTLDGSNYKGTWNQVLTIGSIDEAGKVKLNVTNGSVLKTNDAGTAHYDIIAFHPADINVTDSKLIGWAGIYLKPDAAGSTVKIDDSELVSKGVKGTSNSFATIVTECGNNDIEIIDSKISTTPAEDTYQSLFTLGGTGNNVKLLGSTTYETTNATMGPVTYLPGSLMDNHVYFDDATKAAFQSYFADEDGPQIAEEKETVSTSAGSQELYPLNYTPEVYYYWNTESGTQGTYCDFSAPFKNGWLANGEFIELKKKVALTENITCALTEGQSFTLTLGEFSVTKGSYSVALNKGVTVYTDKSTSIFSAVDEGYVVKETKTDNGYTYTVEEASVKYTDANGKVSYLAKLPNAFNSGTYQLLKDVTHTVRMTTGILATNVTLDLNGHTLTSTATDYAILLNRAGSDSKHKTFDLISSAEGGKLVVNSEAKAAIQAQTKYNDVTIGENVTIEGGGVAMLSENQTLTVSGTIKDSGDFAIATNGSSTKNTTITVNEGAVLSSDITAVYLPGNEGVSATITGAAITGGDAGIEVRGGDLTVNNSNITSTAEDYSYTANGNGTTTKGAAIAVVQHTTKLPTNVTVNGGTLTGVNQIAVTDANGNGLEGVTVIASNALVETTTLPEGFKWVAAETEGMSTLGPCEYVAQIVDGAKFETLQDALDAAHAMTGDVTIELLENISGYSIVHQKAGLNLTIDGKEKTVNGQIVIDGDGRSTGTETLTIQNIKFEDDITNFIAGTDAFILVPSTKDANKPYSTGKYNYAHNVTVKDCSLTSTADAFKAVGFKSTSGATCYNIVMSNVTGDNLHSLAQLTATNGATFDNCSATQTGSFIGANGGGGDYIVSNCTFESHPDKADGYAFREKSGSTATATLTNNNFKAFDAIILGSAGTVKVESGTYVGNISKTAGSIVISDGKFSAPVGNADYAQFIAEGKAGVNGLYPEEEEAKNGIGTAIATVTTSENKVSNFASLEEALAAVTEGSVLKLLDNVQMAEDYTATKSFTLTTGEFTFDANDHKFVLNHNVSVTTDDQTGMFTAPNDTYIIKEETVSGGYKYTCMTKEEGGIFELLDLAGDNTHPYTFTTTRHAESVTYRRTFTANQTGMYEGSDASNKRYQPWFVPFDYTIKSEDLENLEFFKIHLIAASAEAGEVDYNSQVIYIYIETLKAGDTLYGNRPYVVWVKDNSKLDFLFTEEDVDLLAIDNSSRLDVSTSEDKFDFYGLYKYGATGKSNAFSLNNAGRYVWMNPSDRLRAYRWCVQATPRDWNTNKNYANMTFFTVEEGGEATGIDALNITMDNEIEGIYTVDGKKLDHPMKGLNIIRMKDNTVKKVYIK